MHVIRHDLVVLPERVHMLVSSSPEPTAARHEILRQPVLLYQRLDHAHAHHRHQRQHGHSRHDVGGEDRVVGEFVVHGLGGLVELGDHAGLFLIRRRLGGRERRKKNMVKLI